jgi:NAD(P)-dependent dehydrogenase (short-subunit alcohol dehydrogenase family)
LEQLLRGISMRCTVAPREVAEAVFFLSSDSARHITGQEIAVDGHVVTED